MAEENISLEFRSKNIDEIRYLIEKKKKSKLIDE